MPVEQSLPEGSEGVSDDYSVRNVCLRTEVPDESHSCFNTVKTKTLQTPQRKGY